MARITGNGFKSARQKRANGVNSLQSLSSTLTDIQKSGMRNLGSSRSTRSRLHFRAGAARPLAPAHALEPDRFERGDGPRSHITPPCTTAGECTNRPRIQQQSEETETMSRIFVERGMRRIRMGALMMALLPS